jgi:hypothetical protein
MRRLFNLAAVAFIVSTAAGCGATPDAVQLVTPDAGRRPDSEIRRAGIAFNLPEGFRWVSTSWENRMWARDASPDGVCSATLLFSIEGCDLGHAKRLNTAQLRERTISSETVRWKRRRGWPEVFYTDVLALRAQDGNVVTQMTALVRSDDGTVLSLHLTFDEARVTPGNAEAAFRLIDSITTVAAPREAGNA